MEEENNKFLEWYANLKKYEQSYYRKRIAEMCDVNRATVYKWLREGSKIKRPYKRTINEISGLQLFEI